MTAHNADCVAGWDALSIAVEGYGSWLCWARNAPYPKTIAFRFVIKGPTWMDLDFYDEGWEAA